MRLGAGGWIEGVERCSSPNRDARPAGERVVLVVVHAISLPPGEFGGPYITDLFLNRLEGSAHPYFAAIASVRVSAHFLVRRDGRLIQFVSCDERAWHAGVSSWCGRERCNDFSIGVELEGCDEQPFTDAQYLALGRLLTALGEHYPICDVRAHSDIAPGRKTDPGPRFEWARISRTIDFFRANAKKHLHDV